MNEEWKDRTCNTCRQPFKGTQWMKQCRDCYWHLKGFSWQCPKRKALHTPDEMRQLTYGWPFGSGMWGNKELLAKIEVIGGFEQYSYESWDEVWRLTLYKAVTGLGVESFINPIVISGPCLLCCIREAKNKAKEQEP